MGPRDHHYLFAHRMMPKYVHESPDKMMSELSAPMRDAFLMFLWEQAGKASGQPIKPVDVGERPGSGKQEVLSLSVVGVDEAGGWKIILISMPPTLAPGEAMYIAIARNASRVRYFVYEHSSTPGQGNLGEWTADGNRIGYGTQPGVTVESFLGALGKELGFSADGQSAAPAASGGAFGGVPVSGAPSGGAFGAVPVSAAPSGGAFGAVPVSSAPSGGAFGAPAAGGAFGAPAAGGAFGAPGISGSVFGATGSVGGAAGGPTAAPEAQAGIKSLGQLLDKLLLVRAGWPVVSWLLWRVIFLGSPNLDTIMTLSSLTRGISGLLTMAVMIPLLIWLYRVFEGLRGKTQTTPQMAIVSWFIPFANFVLPLRVMREAWSVSTRGAPEGHLTLWWVLFAVNVVFEMGVMASLGFLGGILHVGVGVAAFFLLRPIVQGITKGAAG